MNRVAAILSLTIAFSLPILTGCGKSKTGDDKSKSGKSTKLNDGGHGTEGLHGGTILEVGKDHQYHAEFLIDWEKKTVTIHILDETAKNVKPIKASEVTIALTHGGEQEKFQLKARPVKGEKDGMSSPFEITSDDLTHDLTHDDANPRLLFTVDGKTRSGSIKVPPKK